MEIIQKQVAFFFRNNFDSPFEELSLKVKSKLGNTDAQYIPVPPDAPLEIPRLVMPYKDFNLNFSKNRIDLFFKNSLNLQENTKIIVGILTEEYPIVIDRLGLVQRSFLETEPSKLIDVIEEKSRPINAKELSIRVNLPKEIGGFSCNNIETLNFASAQKIEDGKPIEVNGISIDRDINTLNEKRSEYTFTKDNFLTLLSLLEQEANSLLLLKDVVAN